MYCAIFVPRVLTRLDCGTDGSNGGNEVMVIDLVLEESSVSVIEPALGITTLTTFQVMPREAWVS